MNTVSRGSQGRGHPPLGLPAEYRADRHRRSRYRVRAAYAGTFGFGSLVSDWLGKAMYAGFTLGGLATSVDGQVLRDDGAVVAGLYAVGACASNIAQDGKGYASGTQLGEGSFFGRRAGAHAAARAQGM